MRTKCPDCCYPEVFDNNSCGCCEGVEILTPLPTANRPGLSKIAYRIGTHSSFLETMIARLSSSDFPVLSGLTTRDPADPSIALLDAWATVADVLTFYQERIANEGYLGTAAERRSILELARLVGYKLRPGVASSVFLAYTIDEKMEDEVTIPAGTRTQSIPGPDELPQTFETSEDLKARAKWNNLRPRMTQPQIWENIIERENEKKFFVRPDCQIYFKGVNTNLKPNDPMLIEFGENSPIFCRVKEVKEDADADRTLVIIRSTDANSEEPTITIPPGNFHIVEDGSEEELIKPVKLIDNLFRPPSTPPYNFLQLNRNMSEQFKKGSEAGYAAVISFSPRLRDKLPLAVANATVTMESKLKVYVLRIEASLFGHNAPREPEYYTKQNDILMGTLKPQPWKEWKQDVGEYPNVLYLDRRYDKILPGSCVVVHKLNDNGKDIYEKKIIQSISHISRNAYGMSGETTKITLPYNWWTLNEAKEIGEIRTTKIYAEPEELKLAEEPIQDPIGQCETELDEEWKDNNTIELDGFYEGLESGRWVIVSGEREIEGTSGVRFSELAMLSSVTHSVSMESISDAESTEKPRAGEKTHTFITLAERLRYCFKRDTVTIYGNVVKATHGETRREILGSGDGGKALQSFELKQFPLTHVAASNPAGIDSTLKLIVNDMQWHEVDSLAGLQPTDRNFITRTNDEDKTLITFGNGKEGARLPTGVENIRAEYRKGIGKPGNVKAEQISLLIDKPLGVKEVVNPFRASGGAERESRDLARKNAPLAVKALDRLVSVQDYEDFARTFAGIGKARAVEITDGRRQIVHVTIAGADDIPIDETSDLFRNLHRALHEFGDPFQPVQLAVRELMMIVISAKVRLMPDYQWEPVVVRIRKALLDAFGFEARELGQDVLLSEVISVMQAVRGVAYVDVDTFGGIPEKISENGERRLITPNEISECVDCISNQGTIKNNENCKKYSNVEKTKGVGRLRVSLADLEDHVIRPAQIAFLAPEVPETLILNRIE